MALLSISKWHYEIDTFVIPACFKRESIFQVYGCPITIPEGREA